MAYGNMWSLFIFIIIYTSFADGSPLHPKIMTAEDKTNLPYETRKSPLSAFQQKLFPYLFETDQLNLGYPHTGPANNHISSHTIRKRQATQLTINSDDPPDSSDSSISVGVSHTMGGSGGAGGETTFGGQLGFGTNGDTSWGLNVGHDTGNTNFGANLGGSFGGDIKWGANAGGSLGTGLDWSATADGTFGGATEWSANLDKTWQHQGGSSSSLGAWISGGGNGSPAAGLKYVLKID